MRRWLSLGLGTVLVAAALLAGLPSGAAGEPFSDLGDFSWAEPAISALAGEGLLRGVGGGLFYPASPVFPPIWRRMVGRLLPGSGAGGPYLPAALESRLEGGGYLDREEAVAGVVSLLAANDSLSLPDSAAAASILAQFKDGSSVPEGYRRYLAAAVENGLIRGFPGGSLKPAAPLNRAEMAVLFHRLWASGLAERVLVETPTGEKTALDGRKPVLFFAWWCPHCQADLPLLAKVPRSSWPVLVDTFYRGPAENPEIAGELEQAGLGEPGYYVLAQAPAYLPGVPGLIYAEHGKPRLLVGQEAVAAWLERQAG